jgi:hypothetical protein
MRTLVSPQLHEPHLSLTTFQPPRPRKHQSSINYHLSRLGNLLSG